MPDECNGKILSDLRLAQAVTDEKIDNLDRRINGSMNAIHQHIEQGDGWRKAIIANAIALLLVLVSVGVSWGIMTSSVTHLEEDVRRIEAHASQDRRPGI